mmetsp:Transcript_51119/g.95715  ORF Transcript_51119/g.95715 Transcript_51119/m.95715 type:complete len:97 (+) Transcript_51119:499-789(+)
MLFILWSNEEHVDKEELRLLDLRVEGREPPAAVEFESESSPPKSSSGGKKPIVPHMLMRSAEVTTFARPKSVSFALSSSEMRMFSGFKSRYTMFMF